MMRNAEFLVMELLKATDHFKTAFEEVGESSSALSDYLDRTLRDFIINVCALNGVRFTTESKCNQQRPSLKSVFKNSPHLENF